MKKKLYHKPLMEIVVLSAGLMQQDFALAGSPTHGVPAPERRVPAF